MNKSIGIDFGTSNSTVGFLDRGAPRLIRLEDNKAVMPSAIFYDFEKELTLFGQKAIAAYIDQADGRLLRALKSVLGSSLAFEKTQIGDQRRSFQTIIGDFLGHLKAKTEHELGYEIENVVLGRPVHFVDGDSAADATAQEQLKAIAATCGFKSIQFQFEPIAAALDYEQTVAKEELVLVADIGGGTSDFSIIKVSPNCFGKEDRKNDILANTGVHVGGTDLDKKLSFSQLMPLLGLGSRMRERPELEIPSAYFHDLSTWHKISFLYNRKTMHEIKALHHLAANPQLVDRFIRIIKMHEGHRLAGDVENAKITLSDADEVKIDLDYVEPYLKHSVNKDVFEETIKPERNKILRHIQECIMQAGVDASAINTIFLTGGTTSVPSVLSACTSITPNARIVEGDKTGSVGIGLAIDAAIKFGSWTAGSTSIERSSVVFR